MNIFKNTILFFCGSIALHSYASAQCIPVWSVNLQTFNEGFLIQPHVFGKIVPSAEPVHMPVVTCYQERGEMVNLHEGWGITSTVIAEKDVNLNAGAMAFELASSGNPGDFYKVKRVPKAYSQMNNQLPVNAKKFTQTVICKNGKLSSNGDACTVVGKCKQSNGLFTELLLRISGEKAGDIMLTCSDTSRVNKIASFEFRSEKKAFLTKQLLL